MYDTTRRQIGLPVLSSCVLILLESVESEDDIEQVEGRLGNLFSVA